MLEKLKEVTEKYEDELYDNIDQIKCYLEDIDRDTLVDLVLGCKVLFDTRDNDNEIFSTYDYYPAIIGDNSYHFRIYKETCIPERGVSSNPFIEIIGQKFRIQIPIYQDYGRVRVKTSNEAHWDQIKLTEAYLVRMGLERFLDDFPAFISCAEELIVGKYNQELNKYTELKARECYCEPEKAPMAEEDV